jgi:hypothetical protein
MVDYNVKGRVIHRGTRGGFYVFDNMGRKVYKFVRAAAGPSTAAPSSPNKTGYTKTHYETPTAKQPIYKKNSTGRFHVYMRGNAKKPFHAFSMEKLVRNTRTGFVYTLKEHIKSATTGSEYTQTQYKTSSGHRLFKKGQTYYYKMGEVYIRYTQDRNAFNSNGVKQPLRNHLKGKKPYAPPPPPPKPTPKPAPPPPKPTPAPSSGMVNYDALYKRNKSMSSLAKIRRYARNWLGKNIPANASYKRIALVIHPNKGNRTNKINQAKRTALFKYLSQLK